MLRYVAACAHGCWHLMIGPKGCDSAFRPVPYHCRSWRHPGECCQWKGSQDFARISEAIHKRNDWVYCVLTFKQSEWWNWKEQYKLSYPYWSKLRLRMRRRFGECPYVQTWERHKIEGIHVNLLIGNEAFRAGCERWIDGKRKVRWTHPFLEENLADVGFGPRHWAQPMRAGTHGGMAGYLVKLARELVGADNKGQIPFDAPPHFRRLRATRGLLPPVHKSELTGRLVFTPLPDIGKSD